MEELKKCPFCNGEAECKTQYVYGKSNGHFVFCKKCGVSQDKVYATKTYAIKKWNKRNGIIKEVVSFIDKEIDRQRFESKWQKRDGTQESCDVGYVNEWWKDIFKEELVKYIGK